MQEQYDDIGEILAKYPQITLEQEVVLKYWLNQSDTNRKIFEELSSSNYLIQELQLLEQIIEGKRERWRRFQEASTPNEQEEAMPIERTFTWLHKWQTYVAAATVITIAGALLYIGQDRKNNEQANRSPTVVKTHDVNPGKYKARLILADGSEVILDSAANTILGEQGGMRIVNKDGLLEYEKTGNQNEVLYNTLSTSKGEFYATKLSDGTMVWLNSQSSIRFPIAFNGNVRKVEIVGEAYFEVAPSLGMPVGREKGTRPFIVKAPGGIEVEVMGTHFNINSYADEPAMKTTLLEGKVRVRSTATNAQAILEPGEQAILRQSQNNKVILNITKDIDVEAEVAWRFGYFQFVNADLKTVMHQLERWYDVEVIYQGNVSSDLELIGKMSRNMKLSKILDVLQSQQIRFKLDGNKIIILP